MFVVVGKKMDAIGSSTIRMCGFFGVLMALVEEVCDCEGGL